MARISLLPRTLLFLLVGLAPRLGAAATRYSIPFEEPVHHLGAAPTRGTTTDKITAIVFGTPKIVSDPSTPANQVLEMRAGATYSQIQLTPTATAPVGSKYQLEFDVFTQQMSGSNYGFTVLLDTPEVRTVDLHGPLQLIQSFNPGIYTGTRSLAFADNTPYHFVIQVDTVANLWVVTINGAEICRQPFGATQLSGIRFSVSPMYGNAPVSTLPVAYLDNIKLTDNTVNKVPVFTKGGDQSLLQSAGAQTVTGWATAVSPGLGETEQVLDFQVTNDAPGLFSVAPAIAANGTLTFTPKPTASGQANVSVQLHDSGGHDSGGVDLSAAQAFKITVIAPNVAPTLDPLSPLTLLESAGEQTVTLSGISAGAPGEVQPLAITVASSNPGLIPTPVLDYTSPAATGTLRFTPTANVSGSSVVTVTVDDGASSNHTLIRTFTVNVGPVNNAPSFTKGGDVNLLEDGGPQILAGWATGLSAGPADEASQRLHFMVTTDAPSLFSAGPAISPSGDLRFTPAPNANGVATVTVTLLDDGPTDNGGSNQSAAQQFKIMIVADNDAPSFTMGAEVSVGRDAGPQSLPHWATAITAGPPDEAGQTVHFVVSVPAGGEKLFATQPAISPDGTLTFAPAPTASGGTTVTVVLMDNGSTDAGNISAPQTFQLHVTAIAGAEGKYSALIQPVAGGPLENERTGLLALSMTKGGKFTGRLTLRGRAHVLRGVFDESGMAHFDHGATSLGLRLHPAQPDLTLRLQVALADGTFKLHGTLADAGAPYAGLEGDRALYKAGHPALPYQNVPAEIVGSYTVVFGAKTPTEQGMAATKYPQGDGIGVLTVSANGVARVVGTLADGTGFSYANSVSFDRHWPLYVARYGGAGSISGAVHFHDTPGKSDLDALNVLWFKPAGRRIAYPDGWTGGILVDLLGSKYPGPTLPDMLPEDTDGNAQVTLADGALATPLTKAVNIGAHGRVAVVEHGRDLLAISVRASNGMITGHFVPPGAKRSYPVRAALFPKQSAAFGFFLLPGQTGSASIEPMDHPVSSR